MVSPNFAHAMGMKLTKLEQPISLQLACVGSKSTINYDTKATIMFSDTCIEEYLNMANINYYDIILGMLFLRRLGVALDFAGPGTIWMEASIFPKNSCQVRLMRRCHNAPPGPSSHGMMPGGQVR